MPHNMGHNDGVNCMLMAEGKIFSGGRDENLRLGGGRSRRLPRFVWRPEKSPSGELQLVQDCAPIHLGSSITSMCYEARRAYRAYLGSAFRHPPPGSSAGFGAVPSERFASSR